MYSRACSAQCGLGVVVEGGCQPPGLLRGEDLCGRDRRVHPEDAGELGGNHTLPSREGTDLSEKLRAGLSPAREGMLGHLATITQCPKEKGVALAVCRL